MRRSGVRIPLAPPQADIRSGCRFFLCLAWCCGAWCCVAWRRWCSGRRTCCPVGRAARCARGRRPARSPSAPRASLGASARSPARPPPPPTGTAAGPATAHRHRSRPRHRPRAPQPAPPPPMGAAARPSGYSGTLHSRLLSLTGGAGNSRETIITFAGVCSVSGETDDTIASQIHLFSAQFWRAKASWVSWRRPEVPALVLTVSSRGAVSGMGATKFAQRRLSMAIARKYSPSAGKMAQNGRFMACWASFFAPTGTVTRPRSSPSAPRPGRPVRHCPLYRRNWPCMRIGYCDMDRL